jgi:hypothetical protein
MIAAAAAFLFTLPVPLPAADPPAPGPVEAETERVIVTGSNIPTAETVGPNPVDTLRGEDIERLGVRSERK